MFESGAMMVSYAVTIGKFIGELPPDLERLAAYLGRLKERPAYLRAWAPDELGSSRYERSRIASR
jgi:hypothetical protein